MTRARTTALAASLGLATVCWFVSVSRMSGMDMGVETDLGSFPFFAALWLPMMAAMMLPSAAPAVLRRARAAGRAGAALLFAASYLAVWTAVGLGVYALYRPHGTLAAGALTFAAGLYQLSPLERECRRRCREDVRSGLRYGVLCVGSSIGLMVMLLALGAMSVGWMAIVAGLVLSQKLVSPRASVDVPLALAIVALGVVVATEPSAIPGLTPAM